MDNKKITDLLGFAGSILLIIAVFTPVIDKPFEGAVSFFSRWNGAGVFVIILGFFAGILSFYGKTKLLWMPASITLIVLLIKIYDMNHKLDQFSLGNSFFKANIKAVYSPEWGWFMLFGAAAILLASSVINIKKRP